ncbi:MAG TPA: glycosyltransferase family 2 protein [Mucilaginibacter sp.]
MDTLPVISIVIVTYNAAGTLQTCLNSIYKQKYPALKIIIIDGQSSDGTVDIIKANLNKIYYWKSEKDSGIYDAMNKALKKITGEWVYFLGADDELYDDFSKLAYELKDKNVIYYANVLTKEVKRSGKLSPYQMAKHGIFHQAIIYPIAVFNKYSFNTKYRIVADNVLNMKCWKDKDFRFVYKDYIIAHFGHSGVSGNFKDEAFEKDKSGLILKNYGLRVWLRFKIRTLKEALTK